MATMIKDLGFGEAELAQLKVGFTLLDRNKSGAIEHGDLLKSLRHLGFADPYDAPGGSGGGGGGGAATEASLWATMTEGGVRDGVTFEQFVALMAEARHLPPPGSDLSAAALREARSEYATGALFSELDEAATGTLGEHDIRRLLDEATPPETSGNLGAANEREREIDAKVQAVLKTLGRDGEISAKRFAAVITGDFFAHLGRDKRAKQQMSPTRDRPNGGGGGDRGGDRGGGSRGGSRSRSPSRGGSRASVSR